MAHRVFTDASSVSWLVLAVYPHVEERRTERNRRQQDLPIDPDKRSHVERRQRVRRDMERGWLVFKSDDGRRRLAPIVDGWDTFSDEELNQLCRLATPARRRGDSSTPGDADQQPPTGVADPRRESIGAREAGPSRP